MRGPRGDDSHLDGTPLPHVPGYRIHGALGSGASGGRVLRGSPDASPGRLVAIKLVAIDRGADADIAALTSLQREAIALRCLEHPSILRLIEVVSTDTHVALVTPLAAGGSLAERLAAGEALPAAEAADIGARLASALAHAHAAGIVHRDVKPANVLFDAEGQPLLADLGTATLPGTSPRVTGTVEYLDPRLVDGAPADAATDVYALGITLYEALAGVPPYAGSSSAQTTAAARRGIHVPLTDHLDVPPALATAIERAFARDPADRISDARELATRLAAVTLALGAPDVPPSPVVGAHGPTPQPTSPTGAPVTERHGWTVTIGAGALGATPAHPGGSPRAATDGGRSRTLDYGRPRADGSTASDAEVAGATLRHATPTKARDGPRRWLIGGVLALALGMLALALAGALTFAFVGDGSPRAGIDLATAAPRTPAPVCDDDADRSAPTGAAAEIRADVDGRGCSVPVTWDGALLTVPRADGSVSRFDLDAGPDDVLLFGAWACGKVEAPALYRPSTGELFTFGSLAAGGAPVTVQGVPTGVVDGAPRVLRDARSCDHVEVGPR